MSIFQKAKGWLLDKKEQGFPVEIEYLSLPKKLYNQIFDPAVLFHFQRYAMYSHQWRMKLIKGRKNIATIYNSVQITLPKDLSLRLNDIDINSKNDLYSTIKGSDQLLVLAIEQTLKSLCFSPKKLNISNHLIFHRHDKLVDNDKDPAIGHTLIQPSKGFPFVFTDELTLYPPYLKRLSFFINPKFIKSKSISSTALGKKEVLFDEKINYRLTYNKESSLYQVYSDVVLYDFFYKESRYVIVKDGRDFYVLYENNEEADMKLTDVLSSIYSLLENSLPKLVKKIEYKMNFIVQDGRGLDLKEQKLKSPTYFSEENFISNYYNQGVVEFHDKLMSGIKSNDNGVFLLYGPPGNGKTSYLSYVCQQVTDNEEIKRKFVYLPSSNIDIFNSPQFIDFALERLKDSILVIEDAENIVVSRDTTTRSSSTSTLLQLTDGLLSASINCLILLTFNTDVANIDKALLRAGRLKGEYYMGKLEQSKIDVLKERFNIDKDLHVANLAELFNTKESKQDKPKNKVGFGN